MAVDLVTVVGGNWATDATWVDVSKPTVADDATASALSGNLVIDTGAVARSFDATGYTGTASGSATLALGDGTAGIGNVVFKLVSGMTYTATSQINIVSTSSTQQTFTSAGKTIGNISLPGFNSATVPNIILSDNLTAGAITQNNGKIDTNGKTLNITSWVNGSATGKTIAIAGSVINLTKSTAGDIWKPDTNGVVQGSGSTINISVASTGTRNFLGGDQTYGTLNYTVAGSTGGLDITGANTFSVFNFSDVTNARTLRFTASTTTTILTLNGFNVQGTSSKLMSVSSITAATHTLSSTLQQSCDYLSLTNSIATGGPWYAGTHSVDNGGNSGWIFTDPPSPSRGRGSTQSLSSLQNLQSLR